MYIGYLQYCSVVFVTSVGNVGFELYHADLFLSIITNYEKKWAYNQANLDGKVR